MNKMALIINNGILQAGGEREAEVLGARVQGGSQVLPTQGT